MNWTLSRFVYIDGGEENMRDTVMSAPKNIVLYNLLNIISSPYNYPRRTSEPLYVDIYIPYSFEKFNGDFITRHGEAIESNNVVIRIYDNKTNWTLDTIKSSLRTNENTFMLVYGHGSSVGKTIAIKSELINSDVIIDFKSHTNKLFFATSACYGNLFKPVKTDNLTYISADKEDLEVDSGFMITWAEAQTKEILFGDRNNYSSPFVITERRADAQQYAKDKGKGSDGEDGSDGEPIGYDSDKYGDGAKKAKQKSKKAKKQKSKKAKKQKSKKAKK
jgi:hypothetical protein